MAIEAPFRVRALLPQPDSGETEWILIESQEDFTASGSVQLNDTHGSTRSFAFSAETDRQWYWVSATMSAIALNNDQDSVEMRWNGAVIDRTATYSASKRGEVWTKLGSSWSWLPPDEFWRRWDDKDWTTSISSPMPTSTPTLLPKAGTLPRGSPSRITNSTIESSDQHSDQDHDFQNTEASLSAVRRSSAPFLGKPVQLLVSSQSADTQLEPRRPKMPDYEHEETVFLEWLLWWKRGAVLFIGSSLSWISLIVPGVLTRLAARRMRRWRWSLLS